MGSPVNFSATVWASDSLLVSITGIFSPPSSSNDILA
nr:MAG TPA: hypothetical protein [Caudoviricetes sp.]